MEFLCYQVLECFICNASFNSPFSTLILYLYRRYWLEIKVTPHMLDSSDNAEKDGHSPRKRYKINDEAKQRNSELEKLSPDSNETILSLEQMKSLVHLQELDLSWNELKSLPDRIWDLEQLQGLNLCCNKLKSLSGRIGDLNQLRELNLQANQLISLPEEIGDLTLLQRLDLSKNRLAFLPKRIGDLKQLKELNLNKNQLTSLPEGIGDLIHLQRLNLRSNQLVSLPKRIGGDLKQLKELDLSWNKFISFPERMGDLTQLKGFYLWTNKPALLQKRIGDLVHLQKLDLGKNRLKSLPEIIGDLVKLKELNLSKNQLASLPERIGDLISLQKLDLHSNQLTSLPERMGDLTKLKELNLSNNELTSMSERIGDLTQLRELNLSHNQLRSLPRSITMLLNNIILLDLRSNPLVENGEGDTLGWRELREIFGVRVVLSEYKISGPSRIFTKQEVYDKLSAMPLHWNVEKLKNTILDPVPTHKLQGKKVLDIWKNVLSKYKSRSREKGRDIESYVKTIYDINRNAFKGWRMYLESIENVRNLIEAIFVRMRDNMQTDEGVGDSKAYVPEMCEAMKYCPDRQIATFNMIYSALYARRNASSFEHFIENEIASMKNYIFEMVVTPGTGTQNVHVLNDWKYKLRDELGFDTKYQTRMGTFGQDRFGGYSGNALDAFYSKFTPEYVVVKLVEEINSRKDRLCDSGLFLADDMEHDIGYRKRVFEFPSEEAAELSYDHWYQEGRSYRYTCEDAHIEEKRNTAKINVTVLVS